MSIESDGKPSERAELRVLIHDVRHCLHVIRVGLQLLQEPGDRNDRLKELREQLDHEAVRAAKLFDDLVTLVGAESPDAAANRKHSLDGDVRSH